MSNWIDPRGTKKINKTLLAAQIRLAHLAASAERNFPKSRKAAHYRGRLAEAAKMIALLHSVLRPAKELKPYKELIDRRSVGETK